MDEILIGNQMTEEFAERFFTTLIPSGTGATVVGLSGDLGSGKTTFVKYLANALGISEDVVSPTFILAKYYNLSGKSWKKMIHIDGYRLDDPNEIEVLKWKDMITDPKNLICFEWPERIGGLFPTDAMMLRFTFVDEHTRHITLS